MLIEAIFVCTLAATPAVLPIPITDDGATEVAEQLDPPHVRRAGATRLTPYWATGPPRVCPSEDHGGEAGARWIWTAASAPQKPSVIPDT